MADPAVRAAVVRADSNPRATSRNRAPASVARARPVSPLTRLERSHHGGVQHSELPTQEGEELEMLSEDLASDWLWCRARNGREGWRSRTLSLPD